VEYCLTVAKWSILYRFRPPLCIYAFNASRIQSVKMACIREQAVIVSASLRM
jgi:hypothetical protein